MAARVDARLDTRAVALPQQDASGSDGILGLMRPAK
jgi:hypothetical protein